LAPESDTALKFLLLQNGGWYIDGQAGDTKLGVGCIDHWLGDGLAWDIVHVNFGLHDLNTHG
jgi:hypothetical protein